METSVLTTAIQIKSRIRKELGDIDSLAKSITENGLIEPIVLTQDAEGIRLIAGERRLTALKKLKIDSLIHAKHFIWREELRSDEPKIRLLATAIEMEENLQRKELTWQEQVIGKQKLLAIMQEIHGVSVPGKPTKGIQLGNQSAGFGVRKLAEMLGESPATVSRDLDLAAVLTSLPSLKSEPTKESAYRKLTLAVMMAGLKQASTQPATGTSTDWTLYEGAFEDNINKVADGSVDLIYTDLPYGVNFDKMDAKTQSGVSYEDKRSSIVALLPKIATEAFRVLNQDRFAVFFFGFNYYSELCSELTKAGFKVNPVPVIWLKHTNSAESPHRRYANAYEQAIVAVKGSPIFIRPGQSNIVDVPAQQGKIHIAQQPLALVRKFLLDMTPEGALVLDFFAGSGTTGEASIRSKRRVVLFEKEADSCLVIRTRLGAI